MEIVNFVGKWEIMEEKKEKYAIGDLTLFSETRRIEGWKIES